MSRKNSNKHPWETGYRSGHTEVSPQLLYKHLMEKYHIIVTSTSDVYIYKNCVWERMLPNMVKNLIKQHLNVEYRKPNQWEMVYKEFVTDCSDITNNHFNSDENIINFRNCIFDIKNNKVLEHNPKYLTTIQIPCDFNPNLTWENAPTFKKFMNTLKGDDKQAQQFLLEFLGAILSNAYGWRFKKMLLLIGDGNTGKSVLRELAMNIVGFQNCVSVELKRLTERFGTSAIYGKRLAGSGDLSSSELNDTSILKQITGGDELYAEFKGKDSFTFRYNGFIWCNANQLPYIHGDRGQWVYDRFCIVRCNNVIAEKDRDRLLLDKLLLEKEAIVSISLRYFMNVIRNGYIFTESEDMKSERNKYMNQSNSLFSFVNECCELNKGSARRSYFNKVYNTWCKINNLKSEKHSEIGAMLLDKYGISAKKTYGYYEYPLKINADVIEECEYLMYK